MSISDTKRRTHKVRGQLIRINPKADGVAKRDGLDGVTVKELVEGIVSRMKRQKDGQILRSEQIPMTWTDMRKTGSKAMWHQHGLSGLQET